jgi:hypothetical protein
MNFDENVKSMRDAFVSLHAELVRQFRKTRFVTFDFETQLRRTGAAPQSGSRSAAAAPQSGQPTQLRPTAAAPQSGSQSAAAAPQSGQPYYYPHGPRE